MISNDTVYFSMISTEHPFFIENERDFLSGSILCIQPDSKDNAFGLI
ncbi:unannotated protein [freshwater metagenome]|uniref:Unannotated protein n=1 Tax=freshwater metagenome TaxID=449393 RepID=A0A6J6EKI9_9ZZZZ